MPSDAAAVRAKVRINSRPLTEQVWEDVITEEYRPLVEAAQKAPDFGGEPKTAFGHEYRAWLLTLRAALRLVVGDKS
jgi:hypothetical protein